MPQGAISVVRIALVLIELPDVMGLASTTQFQSHRLAQQLRSRPEPLGLSYWLETGACIEPPGWTVTTSDTQVQVADISGSCPGDNFIQQHLPRSSTPMARCDPQLIEVRHIGIGSVDTPPGKPDRLFIYLCHQGEIPARVTA